MVSVIISVYNAEDYIERCIKSIQNQTYSELEIIAVDDGSTDSSRQICEEMAHFDKRIVVLHKENGGNASARNMGIDFAHGEYLAFVDSDDYIENNMYEEMLKIMKDPRITIVNCGYIVTSVEGKDTVAIASKTGIFSKEEALEDFFARKRNFNVLGCTKLIRKELFEKGMRFNNNVIHEDTEAMPRFINATDHVYVMDRAFYHWIKRENSISNWKKFSMREYRILDVLTEYEKMCKENYPELLPQFYQYRLYTTYEMYLKLVSCVNKKEYWRQAVKLRRQIFFGVLKCTKLNGISKKYDDREIMLKAILGIHLFEKLLRLKKMQRLI